MNIKYHILNWLISVILVIGSVTPSAAQCYEQLTDASGMSMPDEMVTRINQASCEIKQILNLSGAQTFKVYTYGFYAHSSQTYFGLQEARSCALANVESDYFILIGKETDGDGLFKRYDITFVLPDTGPFNCLKDAKRTELQNIMNQAGTDAAAENRIVPSPEGILRETKEYLEILKNCSTCATGNGDGCLRASFKGIDKMLTGLKFRKISVTVTGDNAWNMGDNEIYDHVQKNINIPLEGIGEVNIPDQIYENKDKLDNGITFTSEIETEKEDSLEYHTISTTAFPGAVFIFNNDNFGVGEEWDQMQNDADNYKYIECWVILKDEQNHYWLYSRFSLGKFEGESWDGSAVRGGNSSGSRTSLSPMGIALKLLGNAALDALVQTVTNRVIKYDTWEAAFKNVDVASAAWEGVSSLIPWKKSKYGDIFQIISNGLVEVISKSRTAGYTVKDGLGDFLISCGTQTAFKMLGGAISKNPEGVLEGLGKYIRNNPVVIINKIFSWCFGKCSGQGGCFTGGTLIKTGHNSYKQISHISIGDYVLSHKYINGFSELGTDFLMSNHTLIKFKDHLGLISGSKLYSNYQIEELNIKAIGDTIFIVMPETGVFGKYLVTEISPFSFENSDVASFNDPDYCLRPVTTTIKYLTKEIYTLSLSDGQDIRGTKSHLIYSVTSDNWIPLGELNVGDTLLSENNVVFVTGINKLDTIDFVYNFEVDATHNYLVGKDGILAHNWNCGDVKRFVDAFSLMGKPFRLIAIASEWAQRGGSGVSWRGTLMEELAYNLVYKAKGYIATPFNHKAIDYFLKFKKNGKDAVRVVSNKSAKGSTKNDIINAKIKQNIKDMFANDLSILDNAGKKLLVPAHYLKERELRIFLQKHVYNSRDVPHAAWKAELERDNPGLEVIFDFMENHIK